MSGAWACLHSGAQQVQGRACASSGASLRSRAGCKASLPAARGLAFRVYRVQRIYRVQWVYRLLKLSECFGLRSGTKRAAKGRHTRKRTRTLSSTWYKSSARLAWERILAAQNRKMGPRMPKTHTTSKEPSLTNSLFFKLAERDDGLKRLELRVVCSCSPGSALRASGCFRDKLCLRTEGRPPTPQHGGNYNKQNKHQQLSTSEYP